MAVMTPFPISHKITSWPFLMVNSTVLLPFLSPTNPPISSQKTLIYRHPLQKKKRGYRITVSSSSSSSSSTNQTSAAITSSPLTQVSASDIVRNFYGGVNSHDLASVEDLISDNCVYEDLVFPKPFVGRKAILDFFKKFNDSISKELQFVIDDISEEDSLAVGVTWHLEWKGKPFPFSKGCSFYRMEVVNGKKQIIYGRDSVEPAMKPGETALVAIKGVTWLLQRFPQLADRL